MSERRIHPEFYDDPTERRPGGEPGTNAQTPEEQERIGFPAGSRPPCSPEEDRRPLDNPPPKTRSVISKAGGAASMPKLSPEERRAKSINALAAREVGLAKKRAKGQSLEFLTPEQRQKTTEAAGRGHMAAMTPEERKAWSAKGNEKSLAVLSLQREAFGVIGRERPVRLPFSSARRSQQTFLKLLREIRPGMPGGFGWVGNILKPGGVVTQGELRPTQEWPVQPILLECAEPRNLERAEVCWILWKLEAGNWIELGRCAASDGAWIHALSPLARAALDQSVNPVQKSRVDLKKLIAWMNGWIDRRITQLEPKDRVTVVSVLHDSLAARIAASLSGSPSTVIEARFAGETQKHA